MLHANEYYPMRFLECVVQRCASEHTRPQLEDPGVEKA